VLVVFFVFLTMSAVVSALQELIVQALRLRSRNLREGIHQMLGGDSYYHEDIAKRFYRHPLIAALGGSHSRLTYIEPDTFVTAAATAVLPEWSTKDAVLALPDSVAALKDGELKRRLTLILPPPEANTGDPDRYRDLIKATMISWFDQSTRKMGERYKADATALSYVIAAGLTVLFNVSPIEIAQRLSTDNSMRTAFASVVPELSSTLFNAGQGFPVARATDADQNPGGAASMGGSKLTSVEVQTMLSVYQCTRSKIQLPVGWPWMADAVNSLSHSALGRQVQVPSEKAACDAALNSQNTTPEVKAKLSTLGISATPSQPAGVKADIKPDRKFGPSFATDNPGLILLGWLLATFAAAQGAPFWFDALKKVLGR
jgi:hypothetical protein